jgi:hypothetical protein
VVDEECINPTPSLLNDGDVEPHPGPVNWASFVDEPSGEIPWLRWVLLHVNQRYGENVWWDYYCAKFGKIIIHNGKYFQKNILIKNPWDLWEYKPQEPSISLGIRFSAETVTRDRIPAFVQRFNSKRWYYRHDPFKNESIRIVQDITDKAELDALLAWHLYTPSSDEGYTSTTGSHFTYGEMYMTPLHRYI